jgi:hypothetical protein
LIVPGALFGAPGIFFAESSSSDKAPAQSTEFKEYRTMDQPSWLARRGQHLAPPHLAAS